MSLGTDLQIGKNHILAIGRDIRDHSPIHLIGVIMTALIAIEVNGGIVEIGLITIGLKERGRDYSPYNDRRDRDYSPYNKGRDFSPNNSRRDRDYPPNDNRYGRDSSPFNMKNGNYGNKPIGNNNYQRNPNYVGYGSQASQRFYNGSRNQRHGMGNGFG